MRQVRSTRQATAGHAALLAGLLTAAVVAACGDGDVEGRIEASGTVEATEVHVAARLPGILTAVVPQEGDRVDSGAVLASVDHAELDWRLRQARAAAGAARARLALAEAGPRSQDIEQAEAAVAQAEVQRDAAETDLGRVRQLTATGSATPKQGDDARTRLASAEAGLRLARARLAELRAGTRSEQIEAARWQLEQARAQVGALEQRLADATIRAPRAGVITERLMEPGEMANPGSAVVTLRDLDHPWVKVYLTEVEVGSIRLGQAVQVTLDAAPQSPRSGWVSYIAPTAEFTPKNVQTEQERVKLVFGVKVALDNADGAFKPGLPVDAVFHATQGVAGGSGD